MIVVIIDNDLVSSEQLTCLLLLVMLLQIVFIVEITYLFDFTFTFHLAIYSDVIYINSNLVISDVIVLVCEDILGLVPDLPAHGLQLDVLGVLKLHVFRLHLKTNKS